MKQYIVRLPAWWTETDKIIIGTTDCVDTFLCSSERCWHVDVPCFNYEGYFKVKDLEQLTKETL